MDSLMILIIIIIPLIAELYVNYTYKKNLKRKARNNLTGYDVARKILDENGLNDLLIVETGGTLTDHYDPNRKVIRLSRSIYHEASLASQAVASHEVGHALQDKDGYIYLRIRSFIFPIVNFVSRFSYYFILFGFIAEIATFIWLGIIFVTFGLVFQLVTLPVEFNASKRAIKEIEKFNITTDNEIDGIKSMLIAAALTYVAGLLAGIIQLLRLIGIASDRN